MARQRAYAMVWDAEEFRAVVKTAVQEAGGQRALEEWSGRGGREGVKQSELSRWSDRRPTLRLSGDTLNRLWNALSGSESLQRRLMDAVRKHSEMERFYQHRSWLCGRLGNPGVTAEVERNGHKTRIGAPAVPAKVGEWLRRRVKIADQLLRRIREADEAYNTLFNDLDADLDRIGGRVGALAALGVVNPLTGLVKQPGRRELMRKELPPKFAEGRFARPNRDQLAFLRVLEPFVDAEEAFGVELSWQEAHETPATGRRATGSPKRTLLWEILNAGMKRELLLWRWPDDATRARQVQQEEEKKGHNSRGMRRGA